MILNGSGTAPPPRGGPTGHICLPLMTLISLLVMAASHSHAPGDLLRGHKAVLVQVEQVALESRGVGRDQMQAAEDVTGDHLVGMDE